MNEEALITQPATEAEVQSDYETERGKPVPNFLHGTRSGTLTDPATGIEISIDKVFERVV